jgi:hypothetical protein
LLKSELLSSNNNSILNNNNAELSSNNNRCLSNNKQEYFKHKQIKQIIKAGQTALISIQKRKKVLGVDL